MSRPAPERAETREPAEAPALLRDDAPAAARRPSVTQDDAATGARLVMRTLRLDVATRVENPTALQRAARRRYDPSTWAGQGSEGRTAELLHAAWTAACRHALGVLVEFHPHLADEEWVSGFIFDSQTIGQHREIHGVRHALLINPVDDAGRMRYQISDPASMKRMVAVAIHEVCHCVHDWHDESYAGLLTRMMGEIRDRDIEAEIKAELVEARAWIDNRAKAYEGRIDSIPADRIEEEDERPSIT